MGDTLLKLGLRLLKSAIAGKGHKRVCAQLACRDAECAMSCSAELLSRGHTLCQQQALAAIERSASNSSCTLHVTVTVSLRQQPMQMDHIISVLHPSAHPYRPWRSVWMTKVLQPLNERAAVIITDNIDLIEGSAIEPLLLRLVAHVYANRVILERWVLHLSL